MEKEAEVEDSARPVAGREKEAEDEDKVVALAAVGAIGAALALDRGDAGAGGTDAEVGEDGILLFSRDNDDGRR